MDIIYTLPPTSWNGPSENFSSMERFALVLLYFKGGKKPPVVFFMPHKSGNLNTAQFSAIALSSSCLIKLE